MEKRAEEIMEEMQRRAASYVPEWQMDRKNPDIGTALAEVYARMFGRVEQKYQKLPEKFGIDFFNCLNTSMRPSSPAKGYVVFGLSDEKSRGAEVLAGTPLRTEVTDDNKERIPVETTEDVYAVPDSLSVVCESLDEEDYIGIHFQQEEERKAYSLFCQEAENLQEHVFYLGHPCLLSVSQYGRIYLNMEQKKGEPIEEEQLAGLADTKTASFFYPTESGEVPFLHVRAGKNGIELEKTKDMPPWEMKEFAGRSAYWLGCRVYQKKNVENLAVESIYLASECPALEPDIIYADGTEKKGGTYFPFGERPSVYGEVYFFSDEVLNKKGASVELSFEQEFVKVPIISLEEENPIKWKLIMAKEDIRQEKEYVISIREVVWEYYNGLGWAGLFPDLRYSACFSEEEGVYRQRKSIRFICPDDSFPVLVNAREGYAIRARIKKMNHEFKTNGCYLAPVLSETILSYSYPLKTVSPSYIYQKNNLENRFFLTEECMGEMNPFRLIYDTKDKTCTLYFGFRQRMMQGPIRFLFVMEHNQERALPPLSWEYYRRGKWQSLYPADGTEHFARTGTLTFSGTADADRLCLFGKELYWIRVRDKEGAYGRKAMIYPKLCQFWINAAQVITLRTGIEENLTMEGYQKQKSFSLLNKNIHQIDVWVREDRFYGEEEIEKLAGENRIRQVKDEDGTIQETWIKWQETNQFLSCAPGDQCYLLDANEGRIIFGDGVRGAIPAPDIPNGINVCYSTGGGEACNLLPGQINGLERSIGGVSRAVNPLALSGGYDRETAKEAVSRSGRAIKHNSRAVTEEDYLSLAMEAVRNIEKAACFSGINAEGKHQPGVLTLVLLKKDYRLGGYLFSEMKQQIYDYLRSRLPAGVWVKRNVFIREPLMVEIELMVAVEVMGFQDIFAVRRQIQQTLEEFLDPVQGNFSQKGWEIGNLPDELQLETRIKTVPGIVQLKMCVVFAYLGNKPGKPKVDLQKIRRHPFVLPVNGQHQIQIFVSQKGGE